MKTFKKIFEEVEIKKNILNENIHSDLKAIFKSDKEFDKLKKNAKKDSDKVPDFLDYIFDVLGDAKIDNLTKKYKMDMDELAQAFLK